MPINKIINEMDFGLFLTDWDTLRYSMGILYLFWLFCMSVLTDIPWIQIILKPCVYYTLFILGVWRVWAPFEEREPIRNHRLEMHREDENESNGYTCWFFGINNFYKKRFEKRRMIAVFPKKEDLLFWIDNWF